MVEKDYIDRYSLIKKVHTGMNIIEAMQAIIGAPAADVVEVRRAAWQSWEQDKPPFKWYSCDYCGFHALSRSNYCPNCGADMRQTGDEKEGGKLMNGKPKFILVVCFGNPTYINVRNIESVIFIDGKTRICPANSEGYYETDEPIGEIMQRIQEES